MNSAKWEGGRDNGVWRGDCQLQSGCASIQLLVQKKKKFSLVLTFSFVGKIFSRTHINKEKIITLKMLCVKRKEEAFEKEKHLWGQELVN